MYLFSQLPVVDAVVSHNRRKELNLNLYPSRFFFSLVHQLRNSNVSAIMRCLKKRLKLDPPLLFIFRVMEDSEKNYITSAVSLGFASFKV